MSSSSNVDEMLSKFQKYIIFDLLDEFTTIRYRDETDIVQVMKDVYAGTHYPFVILIDEWDCLFREYRTCLHDRNFTDQKIRDAFCTEYVYRVLNDQSARYGRVFWLYRV